MGDDFLMPWFSDDERAPESSTAGLYAAILERERAYCARIDPRTMERFNKTTTGELTVVATGARSGKLLEALEAGQPVRLQGRRLRPWLELRRDQAFQWFEIRPDDTVRPCEPE